MIAICEIRPQPHYRRYAFEEGLRKAGYTIVTHGTPTSRDDLLVIWNRYGSWASMANVWERAGGTVLVCENGYLGRDDQDRQYYAISVHGHNGSGWFPVGEDDRFAKLGIEPKPWREDGEHILVCGQRGIGSPEMASPPSWHDDTARDLRKLTDRPVRVRLHPGNHEAIIPLDDDLRDCWACVIWSSGSGVKSLINGVPVYFDAPHWICEQASSNVFNVYRSGERYEPTYEDRNSAFHRMAWGQRSVAEIESGKPFVTIRKHLSECSDVVICYPVAGKKKSLEICRAFADGCGGDVRANGPHIEGAAFFYGVDKSNEEAWRSVKRFGLPYYYCDNSYFDQTRQEYFRVTKNALQHSGLGKSDCKRFRALDIHMRPWLSGSERKYLVICPQSEHFMKTIAEYKGQWLNDAIDAVRRFSSKPVCVRAWSADKAALSSSLVDDLNRAYALVTWSSAAAITAVLNGVPCVCTGPSAAVPMSTSMSFLDKPATPNRDEWAGILADNQWTLDEFRSGAAWESLQ